MARITYKFLNDQGVEFVLQNIKDVAGLGIPPVDIISTRGFRQDGLTIQYAMYQARPFSISFDLQAVTRDLLIEQRRAIVAFFGDKKPKTFVCTKAGLSYLLTDVYLSSVFDIGIREVRQLPAILQFIAGDPFFYLPVDAETLADEAAQLEWPLDYLEAGVEYSNRESAQVTIDYQGDVDAPLTIRFAGPATSPWVENETTGERLEVNRSILEGETLEITAGYGQKQVEIINDATEARTNAFHYITSGSVFITLRPGTNIIKFGASAGVSSAAVEISYNELYAGL